MSSRRPVRDTTHFSAPLRYRCRSAVYVVYQLFEGIVWCDLSGEAVEAEEGHGGAQVRIFYCYFAWMYPIFHQMACLPITSRDSLGKKNSVERFGTDFLEFLVVLGLHCPVFVPNLEVRSG